MFVLFEYMNFLSGAVEEDVGSYTDSCKPTAIIEKRPFMVAAQALAVLFGNVAVLGVLGSSPLT